MKAQRLLAALGAVLCPASLLLAQHSVETDVNPLAGNAAAIVAGKSLYDGACQSCHGAEARGDRAPALATGAFRHGNSDGELFLNVRNGIDGTAMPPFSKFTSDQVWSLVSYLRSLAGTVVVSERVGGDTAAGKALFEGKGQCLSCHQVDGQGQPVGPELSSIGSRTVEALHDKIVDPNRPPAAAGGFRRPPPIIVTVKMADGKEFRGLVRSEDSFSLQMVDTDGELHLVDKAKLVGGSVEVKSLMPADYATRLTAAEIQNIVAYLKTLNGNDSALPVLVSAEGGVTWDRIAHSQAEPRNWFSYWGDVQGQHYSALQQIDTSNVRQLQARWAVPVPGANTMEATPLVVDGVMYTSSIGQVLALDARTGRPIWRYQRTQKQLNPYESNRVNRGVAVLGNRLFFGTLDAALVALDRRTGALLWEVQVADTMKGYSITSAPLIVKDKVVTGIAGGEYGIRGFVDAYDPATGKRLWRFDTIPGPGQFGHDTWDADSWQEGSGATWLTGTFDPELNTLYWPVGNPGPDVNGDVRKGDNLFTCSVVALDPDTGQRKWHYQFTPNDTHDWDSTEDMVLVDRVYHGQNRKLILHADRNGVFYILDRTDGKLLSATPFVRTSWADHWDANGRPVTKAGWRSTPEGATVFPALGGGTNFQAPSYSPQTGWLYFFYHDGSSRYVSGPAPYEPGKQFWGRGTGGGPPSGPSDDTQGVMAVDPETGKVQWKYELTQNSLAAGVLSTAGGLVFTASREGNFIALDARTGKALWHFQAGNDIPASAMSYAIDGKQYIAISTSGILFSFALPE